MGVMTTCEDCHEKFESCDLTRVCLPCQRKRQESYMEVRDFMDQNQGMRIDEACEELGIPKRMSKVFARKDFQDRLQQFESNTGRPSLFKQTERPAQVGFHSSIDKNK